MAKVLTTESIGKAYKRHQVELEATFGDILDGLEMLAKGKVPAMAPRVAKKQSEYYEYKYGEVQEAWMARASTAAGAQQKRKVVIPSMQIPKAGIGAGVRRTAIKVQSIELEEEVKEPVSHSEVTEKLEMVMQN